MYVQELMVDDLGYQKGKVRVNEWNPTIIQYLSTLSYGMY